MKLLPFDRCDRLSVEVAVERDGAAMKFHYRLLGNIADVVVPSLSAPVRTDGLWQATCFEAFVLVGKSAYLELNFSPSGAWAAYRFADYRQGMAELPLAAPDIRFDGQRLTATVALDAPAGAPLNLSAVIAHRSGAKSYWALAHPAAKPDFHAPDCFVAKLP